MRKRYVIPALVGVLATGVVASATAAPARLSTRVVKVSGRLGGGEPSLAIGPDGTMYASFPGQAISMSTSRDHGSTWHAAVPPGPGSSGDTSVNVDSSGAVYETNLNGIKGNPNTLQVDLWKTYDGGQHWPVHGQSTLESSNSTGQPLLVDRQWTDAAIPPGLTTGNAVVAMEYHDWGPDQVWVTTSTDGGQHFGLPVNVVQSPEAQAASFCDTIPGGIKIVPYSTQMKHPGRMYAAWLAADAPGNVATGCNETQMAAFHGVWIAWSDDQGQTWTDQLVFDAGALHDGSEIFADLTLDNVGNPYIAFTMNIDKEFDVWATDSTDGGKTWLAPVKVNSPATKTHTHYFPSIAAGRPGEVFVGYIASPGSVPTAVNGKPQPAADADFDWFVYAAQSRNLNTPSPTFTNVQVTPKSIHHGDVCTLGIFCSAVPGADRSLLDFIDVQVDRSGMGHIAFTGDSPAYDGIYMANQSGGPSVGAPGH